MTPLDKLITEYVKYMNDWAEKSHIKQELDLIFSETIKSLSGVSVMVLGQASDHLEYIISFRKMGMRSRIMLELDSLHNPYRSEELYDLELENPNRFVNVNIDKLYPINFLDKKELRDIIISTKVEIRAVETEFYAINKDITLHTIKQLEFLNRSLISKDLIDVYEAFNEEVINLDMNDTSIDNIMFERTGKDKFLTNDVRDIFIF